MLCSERQLAVLCYVSLVFTGVAYSYHDAPNNSTKRCKKEASTVDPFRFLSFSHIHSEMNEKLEKSFIRSQDQFSQGYDIRYLLAFFIIVFLQMFFIYPPPPVHVYIQSINQINTSAIHNIVYRANFRISFIFLSMMSFCTFFFPRRHLLLCASRVIWWPPPPLCCCASSLRFGLP
jgi:hypothetical protein